ncbi:alpha/beta hydrolase [Robertmurraya kyonggiensis]|uniref:Alpha/beta hydrolase n=1 Tax=Robertmurraya kyonggiensis TaxID=1037680 RepID=A0A4U1D991_9BACI|nr:alpha/beta hydrolase [Robertmurraya kyonggiensis]
MRGMFHSNLDFHSDSLFILVPGLLGDRCDSRSMLTKIARGLSKKNTHVLRFDFPGAGISDGFYETNTFEIFSDVLNFIIDEVKGNFTFIKKVILIGFSEGLKVCIDVAKSRNDVKGIGSCNGLIVEEDTKFSIERPRLKNGTIAYNSYYGTWVNFQIIMKYKDYLIDHMLLPDSIDYFGIYSESDLLSQNSCQYFKDNKFELKIIKEADHLFTTDEWLNEVVVDITDWGQRFISNNEKMDTFYIQTVHGKVLVNINCTSKKKSMLVFVHGFGQNKTGPGYLFNQIAQKIREDFNYCMFDFSGSGDSEGEFKHVDLRILVDNLNSVIMFLMEKYQINYFFLLGSGLGNQLITLLDNKFNVFPCFIFPEQINFRDEVFTKSNNGLIDTSDLFEKYPEVEKEFYKLGNTHNRTKGLLVKSNFLIDISNIKLWEKLNKMEKGIVITNNDNISDELILIKSNDKTGLLLDANERDRVVEILINHFKEISLK